MNHKGITVGRIKIPQLMAAMNDIKQGEEMIYSCTNDQAEIPVRGESKAVIGGRDFIKGLLGK